MHTPRSLILLVLALPSFARAQSTLPKTTADSLWAIWSDSTRQDTIRLGAFNDLIIDGYLNSQPDSAHHYANVQYAFAERRTVKRYMASALNTMGVSCLYRGELDKALDYFRRCLAIREALGDLKSTATSLSNIGVVLRSQGDLLGAVDHYDRSMALRERIGDREGQATTLNNLGNIFGGQGLYPRALEYYQRSLRISEAIGGQRGIATSSLNIGNIHHAMGDHAKALENYEKSRVIYEGLGDQAGEVDCLINIGSMHANLGHRAQAMKDFQESLRLSEEMDNPIGVAVSLNNLGNLHKDLGEDTRAMDLYERSLAISEQLGDKKLMSSTSTTIGYLHLARRSFDLAEQRCAEGLELAEAIGAIDRQKMACECLYQAWKGIGDEARALAFHERAGVLGDSLQREETARRLQQMEFAGLLQRDSIAKATERMALEQAHTEEVRRKNLTRNLLLATSALVIVIAISLWGRLGDTRRSRARLQAEKERSEVLITHMLPADIATELKEKGRAEPRNYDEVSVLFTDFKSFTETSAQLSATDLMTEIDTCFGAFDRIAQKHGMERIKTIGDAYMAAGGLPDPVHGSPADVVRAALEMQDFMQKHKAEREAAGKPFFEMRLGIHTGPVIAGIVGVKKFQYDIWGDTVNTASRMESSGEVGQVNISEATYALVKDAVGDALFDARSSATDEQRATNNGQRTTVNAFTFTPRGKVQAKGKGEMEMYFVRRSGEDA